MGFPRAGQAARGVVVDGHFALVEHESDRLRFGRNARRLLPDGASQEYGVGDDMRGKARVAVLGLAGIFIFGEGIPPEELIAAAEHQARRALGGGVRDEDTVEKRRHQDGTKDCFVLRDPCGEQSPDGKAHDREPFSQAPGQVHHLACVLDQIVVGEQGQLVREPIGQPVAGHAGHQNICPQGMHSRTEIDELAGAGREAMQQQVGIADGLLVHEQGRAAPRVNLLALMGRNRRERAHGFLVRQR